jgi:L-phenylalanine/L-methionine N-acetyltransferase
MNIVIRRVEPGDYKAICAVHAQPNAIYGTAQLPFPSEELWKERLAKFGEQNYGLVACVEGEVVGMLSLHPASTSPRRKHAATIGMAVHDKWAGKGIGSALMQAAVELADKWLNVTRLELTAYTDNEAAVRLYKKFGFVIEGTHKRHTFRDGELVDAYTMARVR